MDHRFLVFREDLLSVEEGAQLFDVIRDHVLLVVHHLRRDIIHFLTFPLV